MKIIAATFVVKVGCPMNNADMMIDIMSKNEADIFLFPAYCITGASCSQLVTFKAFADSVNEALDKLCEYSEKESKVFVTSVPGYENIIVRNGDLIQKGAFTYKDKRVVVSQSGDENNADILLLPTAMSGYPCIQNDIIEFCAEASKTRKCTVAVANAGFGESSADNVYKGFVGVFNKGTIVAFKSQETPAEIVAAADSESTSGLIFTRQRKTDDKIPYYGKNEPDRYLNELFLLQTQALYTKITGSGLSHLIVGVSGGLDSTLALLCCESAMKLAGFPSENIIGVSMPGFGTSSRTKSNGEMLMEKLGVTVRRVPIGDAVEKHLQDIAHTDDDVVRENAQARERAQILFDLANVYNAIVVGTGDLSEAALGFSTFGGDSLCHYNVNATVPKTLIRELVKKIAAERQDIGDILNDIAATPISPELKQGQKTEDIVGPYALHDFFIFCFGKRRDSYIDIKNYALAIFDEYDEDEIVSCLDTFYARYKRNQFKRSSSFEGANLIGFTLPYIPSDVDYDLG